MSETMNGGAAFPFAAAQSGWNHWNSPGMTLRDWFAGQALLGLLSDSSDPIEESHTDWYARHAYALADAMLEARSASTGEAA